MAVVDFLPVCDLLFNFISVATYFCDVAFDMIVAYALYQGQQQQQSTEAISVVFFVLVVGFILSSLLLTQAFSLRCYYRQEHNSSQLHWIFVMSSHFLCCGVFWRYGRLLLAPIDISVVKNEMSCLSVLRIVHAYVQCVPNLLIKTYLITTVANMNEVHSQILYGSSALSFFSLCWAMASFNKNIQQKNIHRLILTWIGVISQLLWRMGTISSRILTMVLYASVYHLWIIVFNVLHWICMFLWLLFLRKDISHESGNESSSNKSDVCKLKSIGTSCILSFIFMIDFLNIDNARTQVKMTVYYAIVLIENVLLFSLWCTNIQTSLKYDFKTRVQIGIITFLPFLGGIFFMAVYYKVFHVNKTKMPKSAEVGNNGEAPDSTVFNCALNPAMRKKKKIPRVIPPPPPTGTNGEMFKPFWKEPLPQNGHHLQQEGDGEFYTQPYMGENPKHRNGPAPHFQKRVNYYENDSSGEHGMLGEKFEGKAANLTIFFFLFQVTLTQQKNSTGFS